MPRKILGISGSPVKNEDDAGQRSAAAVLSRALELDGLVHK